MRKVSKLSTGIIAMAIMLLCSANLWAQISTAAKADHKQTSAADQLRLFTPDQSDPAVSNLQMSLLKNKALLESAMEHNTLSAQEIADLKAKIAIDASQINAHYAGTSEKSKPETYVAKGDNQITRAEFKNMSADNQKNVLTSLKGIEITDLVNATAADLSQRQEGKFYIALSDLANYPMERLQQILNNPSTYIIVKDAAMIPKVHVSKATLETMSPEKRAAIKNSNDFVITD